MDFGEVTVPNPLVDAHRDGKLVLFVGAGASVEPPSGLPNFADLVKRIAAQNGRKVRPNDQLDVVLNDLAPLINVHERVRAELDRPGSRPNRTHQAIVELAAASGCPRIVTTNFDSHLIATWRAVGLTGEIFRAPALPLGNNFSGLVHLHGTLDQPSFVISAGDFGRAYLTESWASRFLERMFDEYTVLFIGYSVGDTVMRYIARAIRAPSGRYVLTDNPDRMLWDQLNLTPVGYPKRGRWHSAGREALTRWATFARAGHLEHASRIRDLVSGTTDAELPVLGPEERSYLEHVLAGSSALVHAFTTHARGLGWLSFAAAQPAFRRLADPRVSDLDDAAAELGRWFAESYINNEERSAAALATLDHVGGTVHPVLTFYIAREMQHRSGEPGSPRPRWLDPWISAVLRRPDLLTGRNIAWLLRSGNWADNRDTTLLLFECLLESVTFSRNGALAGRTAEVGFRGDAYDMRSCWEQVLAPALQACSADILTVVASQLARAHRIGVVAGAHSEDWDNAHFDVRDLSLAPQHDSYHEPMALVVHFAQRCLSSMLDALDPRVPGVLAMWQDSQVPVLRRLSVHGWSRRTDVGGDERVRWLLDSGLLHDKWLIMEVYELLECSLAQASTETVAALVDQTLTLSTQSDLSALRRDHQLFQLLTLIARHTSDPSAALALDEVTGRHPAWTAAAAAAKPSAPEIRGGVIEPVLPMTVEEFIAHIEADPVEAVARLAGIDDESIHWASMSRPDVVGLVAASVVERPQVGHVLISFADERVLDGVIRGWAAATLSDDEADHAIASLRLLDPVRWQSELSRLLSRAGRGDDGGYPWHRHAAARAFANDLWASIDADVWDPGVGGWLSRALNHPAGQLAEFWIRAVQGEWTETAETWSGMPEDLRDALQRIIAGRDAPAVMAQVMTTARLHFFFGADRNWTVQHLLPLMSWEDTTRAMPCWDAFLAWGRFSNSLLDAGLRGHYRQSLAHAGALRSEARTQLARHLASLALFDLTDTAPEWPDQIVVNGDEELRAQWAAQTGWALRDLTDEVVEEQWHRWICRWWTRRLASDPKALTPAESREVVSWVAELTISFPQGVELALRTPVVLDAHADVLDRITPAQIANHPRPVLDLCCHLMSDVETPFYGCHHLPDIVQNLAPHLDPRPLINAAAHCCPNASTWLS